MIGGLSVSVPPGVRVEITRFSLLGGRRVDVDEPAAPSAPLLRLRAYGLIGGVYVRGRRPDSAT
jgi:hypothetical protein